MYLYLIVLHSSDYLRPTCLAIVMFRHCSQKDNSQIIRGLLHRCYLCQRFHTSFLPTSLLSSALLNSSLLQRIAGSLEMGYGHVEIHLSTPLHRTINAVSISYFELVDSPSSIPQQHHERNHPISYASTTTSTITYHSTISAGTE